MTMLECVFVNFKGSYNLLAICIFHYFLSK